MKLNVIPSYVRNFSITEAVSGIFDIDDEEHLIDWFMTKRHLQVRKTNLGMKKVTISDFELTDKDDILKLLLTALKYDGRFNRDTIKRFISGCRDNGINYPEFEIIEKSLESL